MGPNWRRRKTKNLNEDEKGKLFSNSLSQFIWDFVSLPRGLRSSSSQEVRLDSMTSEGEVGDSNRLGIDNFHGITVNAVTSPFEASDPLDHGRLKVIGDEDVPEVVLRVQVVDREPLDVGEFLVVREFQREFFVEVSLQDVGAGGGGKMYN